MEWKCGLKEELHSMSSLSAMLLCRFNAAGLDQVKSMQSGK